MKEEEGGEWGEAALMAESLSSPVTQGWGNRASFCSSPSFAAADLKGSGLL